MFRQVLLPRTYNLINTRFHNIQKYLTNGRSARNLFSVSAFPQHFTGYGKQQVINYSSTAAESKPIDSNNAHSHAEKMEFKAETRALLDIVAKSLYSNHEVFLRELISNASDALEKFRYHAVSQNMSTDLSDLRVNIKTQKQDQILIIEDNGIGMSKEDLINNIGTIAKSGSKAFIEELKQNKSSDASAIIGQFGVGFYSCFVVAKKVEVFSKCDTDKGYYWSYDGSDHYEIKELEEDEQPRGTKIVIHLKPEYREYANVDRVREVIKKYSNFMNCPVFVEEEKCNVIQPLWLMDPKSTSDDQYNEFYKFISASYVKPRFKLHYSADVPHSIKALLYVPTESPSAFPAIREKGECLSLYAKRVLIKNKAIEILPEWCHFMCGVVDCEDIPLNLSRELLQNSPLIAKIRGVLERRVIKFLSDCAKKEPVEYDKFYSEYHLFLKMGIMTAEDETTREKISELWKFETSKTKAGETKTLSQICEGLEENDIYYLFSPSRAVAESSPYLDILKSRGVEVIFCYNHYDEYAFLKLEKFKGKNLKSVESEFKDTSEDTPTDFGEGALKRSEIDALLTWSKETLGDEVREVKVTNKLSEHPCAVTLVDATAARQVLRVEEMRKRMDEQTRKILFTPNLELNPKHPIIKKLSAITETNPELAKLLMKQLCANAMLSADLVNDAGPVILNMNELLTKMLEKH